MQENNLILRSRSISDDDLCASCEHLDYRPGETSICMNLNFMPDWVNQSDEDGYVKSCPEYSEVSPEHSEMLDELYDLTAKEHEGLQLSEKETSRYVELVDTLKSNNVAIPFGIEI